MAKPKESAATDMKPSERLKNTRRNDECPCGSGKKYKKCHLASDDDEERQRLTQLHEQAVADLAAAEAEAEAEEEPGPKKKTTGPGPSPKTQKAAQVPGKGQGRASVPNNLPRRKAI